MNKSKHASSIMKKVLALIAIVSISAACQPSNPETKDTSDVIAVQQTEMDSPEILPLVKSKKIKNVIMLIGDGTGLVQLTTGQYALVGKKGRLHIQTLPVTGFVRTYSSDNLITDSAAGATAYTCGLKTYNGAIGVNAEGKPCKTILELAEEKGLSTGLVATSSITHATPASFAAHVAKRSMQEDIAAQFLNSGVEVFLGGGVKWFSPEERSDSLDLINRFKEKGYQVLLHDDELASSTSDRLLGLFAHDGFEREEGEPTTAAMTQKALDVLSKNEKGFFLMVEGSQIDWGGHANNADYVVREVADFDNAIKTALDFAQKDGETLVVITADHETGGMTLQKQKAKGDSLKIVWTTSHHTGTPIPLMAYGPQATEFMGWRQNTYVGQKIVELLGVGELPQLITK
jgi:alkaline phosphatase